MKHIPAELRELRQWVRWQAILRDGQPTKAPFQVSGAAASSTDATTWNTYQACQAFAEGYSGVGFVFTEADPFIGVDCDACRDPETGQVEEWAAEIISRFDSYSEVSPSGTGVKIWVRAKWKGKGRNRKLDFKPIGGKAPGVEVYSRARYFAVTGEKLTDVSATIEQRDDELAWLFEKFWPEPQKTNRRRASQPAANEVMSRAAQYLSTVEPAVSGQGGHNATFRAACMLVCGFDFSESEAMSVLRGWNGTCEPPWSERELLHKVQDAAKQEGERGYLLRGDAPQSASGAASANASTTNNSQQPPRVTTLESAASKYLESVDGDKSGLIETGLPELDYAIGGGYELGEMVILAARPSHGKSAVGLQFLHACNACGLPALMVSEEMSAHALGKRVVQFASGVPQEHWHTNREHVESDLEKHFERRASTYVVESCGSAAKACEEIEQAVEQHEIKIAAVDYAQLLTSQGGNRYEQVTNTSVALRSVASKHGVGLLLLCQLSRAIEGRKTFSPMMSDLKETGQFEQDADVILFLVWPHRIDPKNDPHRYQMFVAKNRNRPINQAALEFTFNPSRQTVSETKAKEWRPEEGGYEAACNNTGW